MARNFIRTSSQYLSNANAIISAAPLTMACWIKTTDLTNTKVWMVIDNAGLTEKFLMFSTGADTIIALTQDSGGSSNSASSAFSSGVWFHAAAVFASSASRTAYLDGTPGSTNTGSRTPASLSQTLIGGEISASFADGDIAYPAIWNVALTTDEVAALAAGASPLSIQPDNLVAYWGPLGTASPEIDQIGSFDLTLNNAPASADNPFEISYPDNSAHANVTENISSTAIIAPVNASHAHEAGNIALSQIGIIQPANTAHSHSAAIAATTQVLTVTDAAHSHTATETWPHYTNLYFSNAGNDSAGDGSQASPFNSIAKFNAGAYSPGDTIYFNKGDEWWETLIPPSSGASGNPITFGAYGTGADPIIYSSDAFRYNHRDISEYDATGLGHNVASGYSQNDGFEEYTGDTPDFWNTSVSGTGTFTIDTSEFHAGAASAKLFTGTGFARVAHDLYFVQNQRYEISFWAKSDGTGTATARFFHATTGLADTKTGDTYQTWTGTANISDLAVSTSDTTWTEKKIQVLVDASNHATTFQITSGGAGGTVWIDDIRIRPMWTNYSGDTWMAPYEADQTGSIYMVAFGGVPTKVAANAASVDATTRWYLEDAGTVHDGILYVNSPNGDPSASAENIDIATKTTSYALDGNDKAYLTFDGLEFRNAYTVGGNFGSNVTIQNSTLSVGLYPVLIDADSFTLDASIAEHGDWIVNIGACNGATIKNSTIRHAAKYNPSLAEGGGLAPSVVTGDCINLLVENNTIHDCEAYGIAEYGTDASNRLEDAIYRYNTIYDCWFGTWTQALANGISNSKFYYNLIHSPKASGDAVGGGSITTSCGYLHYRAGNTVDFYNNTVVGFSTGIRGWNGVLSLDAQNNLIAESVDHHVRTTDAGWTISNLNNNLYYSSGSPVWQLAGTTYNTLGDWQAAIEATAIGGDPLFVDSGNDDYSLQYGSPAINAGADVSLTTDVRGNIIVGLPDIGAYEFLGSIADSTTHAQTAAAATLAQVQTLVATDASHAHNAAADTLAQTHALAVTGAEHQSTAANAALAQGHVLAIGAAEHVHVSDDATIDIAAALGAVAADHAHEAGQSVFIQNHVLADADAAHAVESATASVAQTHILPSADVLHGHVAPATTFTAAGALAADTASHAQDADAATLAQNHILPAIGASHDVASSTATLFSAGELSATAASHDHVSEAAAFVQAHTVEVADIVHDHAADQATSIVLFSVTAETADHAHETEQATVAQIHNTAVASADHAQVAENIRFEVPILTASASHEQSVETGDFLQTHLIVGIDGNHAHASADADLAQIHALVALNATHGLVSDGAGLVDATAPTTSKRAARFDVSNRTYNLA